MNKEERMRKYTNISNGMKKTVRFFIILLAVVILLPVLAFGSFVVVQHVPKVIYKDQADNGHEIKVVETFRGLLTNYHVLTIQVDGTKTLELGAYDVAFHFSSQNISLEKSENSDYILTLDHDRDSIFVRFSEDFSQIVDAKGYDVRFLKQDMKIENFTSYVHDPF